MMSSAIIEYIASLPDDAEEIDLSSFELIEEMDEATWMKLQWRENHLESMKRVTLPPSLLTIAAGSFMYRSQLTEVILPSLLRCIEVDAFVDCSALAMHDFKLPESLEELGSKAFYKCESLTGKLTTHITKGNSFFGCTGLTALDLTNCKELKFGSFHGCSGLIELDLPESLQYIRDYAFAYCTSLTGKPKIPPFVSFISDQAFKGCSGLTNVEQAIEEHFTSFESWKARGIVLMTLIRFDEEYRRVVEKNGGTLRSALSNSFLSDYSKDAQLIYKATAHVDGTDNLANGICRLIISFLPMNRKYLGSMLSNEEIDDIEWAREQEFGSDSDDYDENELYEDEDY
jgi:hypothetical protein